MVFMTCYQSPPPPLSVCHEYGLVFKPFATAAFSIRVIIFLSPPGNKVMETQMSFHRVSATQVPSLSLLHLPSCMPHVTSTALFAQPLFSANILYGVVSPNLGINVFNQSLFHTHIHRYIPVQPHAYNKSYLGNSRHTFIRMSLFKS